MKFSLGHDSLIESQMPLTSTYDALKYELTIKFKTGILDYKEGSTLKLTLVASARTVNSDYMVSVYLNPLAWC
jgi:hypothetical protein